MQKNILKKSIITFLALLLGIVSVNASFSQQRNLEWINLFDKDEMSVIGENLSIQHATYDSRRGLMYSLKREGGRSYFYVINVRDKTISEITDTGIEGEIYMHVVDSNSGRVYAWRVDKDRVFSIDLGDSGWTLFSNGSSSSAYWGAGLYFNSLTMSPGFFGGYGGNHVNNSIFEVTNSLSGDGWVERRRDVNDGNLPKRAAVKIAYGESGYIYAYGGLGNFSGYQMSSVNDVVNGCVGGYRVVLDVGEYCWLRDLWSISLENYEFERLLRYDSSAPLYGPIAYDSLRNTIYLLGGHIPADFIRGQDNSYSNNVYVLEPGKDDVFREIVVTGDGPTEGNNVAVYDGVMDMLIVFGTGGVWGIALGEQNQEEAPLAVESKVNWRPNGTIHATANVGETLYVGGSFSRIEAQTGGVVLFSGIDNSSTSVIAAPFNETAFSARAVTVLGDTLLLGGQAGLRLVLASNDTLAVSPLNLPGEVYALHVRGSHVFVGGEGFVCRIPRSSLAVGAAGRCQLLGTVRGTVFALHHDGAHLYVGGEFTSWNSLGEQAELTNLARVSGLIVDTEWRPLLNGAVHAIASYDGRLVVGGAFTTVGTITRNRLLAFDLATDALLSWNPNVSGPVFTLALDPGFLYVGGSFTTIGGGSRSSVARFSRTTHELNAWSLTLSGQQTGGAVPVVVRTILPRTSDVLLGGTFTQVGGQARRNVAAVALANGAVQAWRPVPNGDVSVLVARGTDVVMAGSFTIGAGIEQANLAAFTLTGASGFTPVSAFVPVVNGTVRALSYCSGTLYAGGDFREAGGLVRDRLAGFHASTGAVSTWNPAASATVQALDCSGTTLFAGGAFTQIDGNTRNRVASFDLSASGALTTWAPVVNNTVNAIEVAGNTVYLGGQFTQVGGASRNRLASVGAQSGMVTLWNPNVNGTVHALAVDHRNVYAAGEFTQVGTLTRDRLVQVDPAGLATSWNPSANGTVRALLYDAGVLYAGGEFTSVSGAPQTGLAAFATRGSLSGTLLTPGGTVQTVVRAGANVVIGGNFTSGVSRGTALTASGSDPSERVYLHVREGSQSVGLQVATDANVSNHTTGQNLPPVPPAGIFDVRLLTSTTTASHTWIAAIDSFPLQIQRSVSSTPVQVGFVLPPNALGVLYNGTAVVATISGREVVELNIPGTTWNLGLELFMDGAEISHAYGTLPSREWRMLSLPFTPANGNSSVVFSPATDVFGFETGYAKVTSLEALRGYWVYVDSSSARVVGTLSGLPPAVQEIRVREGWNLIGSFSTAVARTGLSTVPRTLITGSVFGRSDGGTYEPVTELLPGRAYWLRASAAGVIRPGVASFAPALRAQEPELLPLVRVTDASGRSGQVYRAPDAATVQNYLLPPLPPPPSFDLRLANGSLATTFSAGEAQVLVQGGTYPLRVEAVPGAPYMEVVSANGTVLGFLGERPVVVTEPGGFTLRAAVPEVPEALEVRALYPQPASREVTLQIGLPEAGFATVTVFNLIGQEVMRVELAEREAGFARETLRVDDLPAGMYVLRIHTDRESQTRSLVIAR